MRSNNVEARQHADAAVRSMYSYIDQRSCYSENDIL